MDETEALADTTYRSVLKKYPKSVKLLRAYAAFLEEVSGRAWPFFICLKSTKFWP